MNCNLYTLIEAAMPEDRSTTCLEAEARHYRYSDVHRTSAQIAAVLKSAGVGKGDRVVAQVEKCPEALFLYLACLRAGAVYVPVNTAYTLAELSYYIEDADPAVIVCDPSKYSEITGLPGARFAQVLTMDRRGCGSVMERAADTRPDFQIAVCAPDDLAALLYTSGTTGRSKGAMLTHANLTSNALTLRELWQFTAEDVLLHALPIYHTHGLFVAVHCALLSGARMIFLERFDPRTVLPALSRATVMMGVPTYYVRLLGDPEFSAAHCSNMRLFISGSAPLLEETFAAFESRTGHRILERYGMTETGMSTSNPLQGLRRPGTVGPPLPGVEVRIAAEDGTVLPQGATGVLEVRGPNVFSGYWRMPEKTKQEFRADGFFITGDVACIDPDGYVMIVGRARDLIITGGLNVYPREVEAVIDRIEGVAESAVVGLPHPDFGEGVAAAVVCKPGALVTAEAILLAAREQLAAFKVPKKVFLVEDLPRNAMGKVQKNVLRDRYAHAFR